MAKALKDAGISDYSIFPDPATLSLFAMQKPRDGSSTDKLPKHSTVRKW
jgi:L-rhamnose mutarotase